jgi:PmbA protein
VNPNDIVDACLERGADDVVCHVGTTTKKQIRFSNNAITASKIWDSVSASIFIAKDSRVVVTSLDDMAQLDATLDQLFKLARVLEPTEEYYGIAQGPFRYREVPAEVTDTKEEDIIEQVISIAGDCRAAGALYNTTSSEAVATSRGVQSNDGGSAIELSVRMFSDAKASGHAVSCSRTLSGFDPEGAAERARDIALRSRNAVLGKEGTYNVLFSPLCFANLLDHMSFQASAFYVDSGLSFFKDKIGQQVGSELVTLYDDGVRPDGLDSARYDEEGMPTKKTTVIENGILKTYLHNTSTAHKYGTESTANAGLIAPHPNNVVLQEGDMGVEELLSEMKSGLYITNTWYTRYQNYATGDFSTIPRDGIFRVENGEVTSPVREIRISDNMLGILSRVSGVGSDTQQIHWWETERPTFTPNVLVSDVTITRSTG